jgi:hypothetical protein
MSDFASERATLDMNELDIRKTTTPELIVVNRRAFEATTSIGESYQNIALWELIIGSCDDDE